MSSDIIIAIVISFVLLVSVIIYKLWGKKLAIRSIGSQSKNVSERMARAVNEAADRRDKAKDSLFQVVSYRMRSERNLNIAKQELEKWQKNVELATKENRPDLVEKYTARQKTAEDQVTESQSQFDRLRSFEIQMEKAFNLISGQYNTLASLKMELESRAAIAETKAVQLLDEIDRNGNSDIQQAVSLVKDLELKAKPTNAV